MKLVWMDQARNRVVTAGQLLTQINSAKTAVKYIYAKDPFFMMLDLFVGMVHGQEMVLLDSDFSMDEIRAMGIDTDRLKDEISIPPSELKDLTALSVAVREKPWKLWMFTSGTTGLPKKVCHTYATLGRNVRLDKRHADDVWAFAYRFSHMAGIQVLLQAVTNENPMVYVFESAPRSIVEQMRNYHCTHISATPTFYRNLLSYLAQDLPALQHMTLGGEKYDKDLCAKLQAILPSVKLHNIYASTETGSVLNAVGDAFVIPAQYQEQIKISEQNELMIHRSLLGEFPLEGEWYNTHDLVEVHDEKIYFLSRKSDLLNIGGYKVNPLEVEVALQAIEGIQDCLVYGQKNSVLGTLLVADVVPMIGHTEKEIKKAVRHGLKEKLQEFKIPRILQLVDNIERTRSGKKVRK